jgi:hypothetical protein
MSIVIENSTSADPGVRRARWLAGVAYLAASAIALVFLPGYLERVGGPGNVPNAMYLAFGPFIALAHGHGLFIYLAATVCVLPLLVFATGRKGSIRVLLIAAAIAIWIVIGRWMYAG